MAWEIIIAALIVGGMFVFRMVGSGSVGRAEPTLEELQERILAEKRRHSVRVKSAALRCRKNTTLVGDL